MTRPQQEPESASLQERLRGLLAKATPGPWEHPYGNRVKGDDQWVAATDMLRRDAVEDGFREAKDNAALIVELRNSAETLLDTLATYEARIAELERALAGEREACAEIADNHVALGYMSGRERDYCHGHGDEIAEMIRARSASPAIRSAGSGDGR